ncbi:zinc finger CCCH domain-containing protein 15 [Pempheris klunzingeri]|uniref:zinc finger CCCH domain-containing protein 15 n=1 Tax=Pempheris klunzingeri TaxID=3127111 RepID=UPI003980ECF7
MPPKKPAPPTGSKKTQEKKKEKIIEDKTFGLKNKKGAKQQKFIKNVTQQVKYGQQSSRQAADADKTNKKTDKKKELDELNELFKPVVAAQKVSKGVDPKSVLCAFFKQGQCTKGDKCKFSHDLSMERKCEKRSVYVDERDEDLEKDTMDNWDEKKLEEVVNKKHGEAEKKKPQTQTQIVCKHFLDAIENNKYGWFWVCPGGGDSCMYRHALPPGFVLKKDKKKEEKEEEISLEELIENERAALGADVTRITLETFLAWKKRKRQEKVDKAKEEMEKKKADFKAGKSLVVSGREVFEFRPELVDDDDDEAVDTRFASEDEEDEEEITTTEVQDIDLSRFVPQEVDNTGITVASTDRFTSRKNTQLNEKDSEEQLNGACGGAEANGLSGAEGGGEDGGGEDEEDDEVPVDENLFTGEDLEELDEELNTLALED